MGKDPAVLFYTSDFLSGTMTMSDAHVGKYIRLLCLQHQKGRLSEKDMLYICNTYVGNEDVFDKFTKDKKGFYYNSRMEHESIKRKEYSKSRSLNVSKRYKKKTVSTYVEHMENENEDVKRTTNTSININNEKPFSFTPPKEEVDKLIRSLK